MRLATTLITLSTGLAAPTFAQECVESIRDQAGGACIEASSNAELGRLFPLNSNYFFDADAGLRLNTLGLPGEIEYGLRAEVPELGVGVFGTVGNPTGGFFVQPYAGVAGVAGDSAELVGVGVMGTGVEGAPGAVGVWGRTYSPDFQGVAGQQLSQGRGAGVGGRTFSRTSFAKGVMGVVESTTPGGFSAGVRGVNKGTGGSGIGVYGSQDGSGWGVHGYAGSGRGVYGTTGSSGGYGIYSGGNLAATGTKLFVQPHPVDPAKEIRFVCLEGNESGTYFRGTSELEGGVAVIEVPEEFRLASESEGLTVQLTLVGGWSRLWVESRDLEHIVVRGDDDVTFDYFVNGVRRGFAQHQPIAENRGFVPLVRDVPFGEQYPEALRQILVENGTLNADFTPNEETAYELGWELMDAAELEEQPDPLRPQLLEQAGNKARRR